MPDSVAYTEDQANWDWLVERWEEFSRRPFPNGVASIDAHGQCLAMVEANLAELIRAFVSRRKLHPRSVEALESLYDDVRSVVPILHEEAARYFSELKDIASSVMRFCTR